MKQKITLVVSGIMINIVTENDPDYVRGLGRLLENRISDLVISSSNRQKNEALLLCALDYLSKETSSRKKMRSSKKK